jgi:hypothetical protein
MSAMKYLPRLASALLALGLCAGCETTGGGSASTSIYYGTGFNDPWYYGAYYDRDDIVVTPPTGRPVRPEQPIYRPPAARPTPLPSIPSTPRPMPRPAMRR